MGSWGAACWTYKGVSPPHRRLPASLPALSRPPLGVMETLLQPPWGGQHGVLAAAGSRVWAASKEGQIRARLQWRFCNYVRGRGRWDFWQKPSEIECAQPLTQNLSPNVQKCRQQLGRLRGPTSSHLYWSAQP